MILMEFKNNHSELLHSYNALGDIVNKPSFDIVYSKVQSFCLPFITKSYTHYNDTWNAQKEKRIQDFSNNNLKLSLF